MGDELIGKFDSINLESVFLIFKKLSISQQRQLLVVTHDMDFAKKTDGIIEVEDGGEE